MFKSLLLIVGFLEFVLRFTAFVVLTLTTLLLFALILYCWNDDGVEIFLTPFCWKLLSDECRG